MTISPLANPTATRDLLEEFGLATKHRLGQNFLIDNHVIERICALAELGADERVLEVGPGIGTLTPVSYTHLDVYKRQWGRAGVRRASG